jgi:predicted RNase H-like nuclease
VNGPTDILEWQAQHRPAATIVLLDHPTIMKNAVGQRPVENLVVAPVPRKRDQDCLDASL